MKYTFSEIAQTAELVSNFWPNLHILYTNNLWVCQLNGRNGGVTTPRSLLTSLRSVCANSLDGIYWTMNRINRQFKVVGNQQGIESIWIYYSICSNGLGSLCVLWGVCKIEALRGDWKCVHVRSPELFTLKLSLLPEADSDFTICMSGGSGCSSSWPAVSLNITSL